MGSHVIQQAFDVLKNTKGQRNIKKRICIVYLHNKIEFKHSRFPRIYTFKCININAEEVMKVIFSGDNIPSSSAAAKTSDNVSDITAKSYEDIINVNEQQTNSSMSVTKEYEEAGKNDD